MTGLISLTQNQTTKLNTYTKTQTIHQVSSGKSIKSRLSTQSFNEKIFQEALPPYQKALQNSGYRHTLTYKRPENDNNSTNINKIKRNSKQQIIWFNPPLNLKMKKKIGKLFSNLLDKHFPPSNKLQKLFNRTTVKISYSFMPNMNSDTYA